MKFKISKKHKIISGVMFIFGVVIWNLYYNDLTIKDLTNELVRHPINQYPARDTKVINTIVIHHTAMSRDTFDVWETADLHTNKKNWPGIGYHYFIDALGTIYQCNKLNRMSYHAKGYNMVSVGVCLAGNFEEEEPTTEQIISLISLLKYLNKKLDIEHIVGHNQCEPTLCPGKNLDLTDVLEKVRNKDVRVGE